MDISERKALFLELRRSQRPASHWLSRPPPPPPPPREENFKIDCQIYKQIYTHHNFNPPHPDFNPHHPDFNPCGPWKPTLHKISTRPTHFQHCCRRCLNCGDFQFWVRFVDVDDTVYLEARGGAGGYRWPRLAWRGGYRTRRNLAPLPTLAQRPSISLWLRSWCTGHYTGDMRIWSISDTSNF